MSKRTQPIKENKFRSRGPSWQEWTDTEASNPLEAWAEVLNKLSKVDPTRVAGFRIQVNFKRQS